MASTDMQRLIVSLEARTKAFENALNRANGVANRRAKAIESRFALMNRNVSAGFMGLSRGMVTALAAGASVRGAQTLIDTSVRIQNALKVTGLEGEALAAVYDDLFASAQKNFAPLESLVSLYSRVALAQNELGVSSAEIVGFTDTIAMALRVQGVSATEASGALTQLSQSMAGGIVRAEEFNSIVEGAPSILRAAAAGIAEADGSIAKLRQIMLDGELSSQAFFRGIEAGSYILEDQLAGAGVSVSQAFVRLQNVLVDAAGRLNEGTDASEQLAGAIEWLADAIANTDFGPLINNIGNAINAMSELVGWVDAAGAALGRLTGLDQVGPALRNRVEQSGINERIDGAFSSEAAPKGDRVTTLPPITVKPDRPKPISIADYAPTGGSGGGGGGGRSRRGGGGGRSGADGYQREVEQIKERTAAIMAETEAMAGINPLIDDYDMAITKASATQELLNAAKKAGLEITPALKASIDELATGYANATVEANKLAESQDQARRNAEEMSELGKDVLGGFISDLRAGKSASEALANALSKVADKLLEVALNSIFDGGGGFGAIFGSIGKLFGFEKGGYTGNGGRNEPAGVVHKGEYVFSKKATQRIGVGRLEAMHKSMKGYASGGFVGAAAPSTPAIPSRSGRSDVITVNLAADESVVARVADQRIQTAAGPIVQLSVQQSRKAIKAGFPTMMAEAQSRSA